MTNELDHSQRLDKFMVPLVYTGIRLHLLSRGSLSGELYLHTVN
jgi:hypothetical protein